MPSIAPPVWDYTAPDARYAHDRRGDFAAFLRRYGDAESDYFAAELIFGELVANVARHAPGSIEVRVDWSCAMPRLHVHDTGSGFTWAQAPGTPPDPFVEARRGLFLVASLGDDVVVEPRDERGTCVSVKLPVRRSPT